MPVIASGGAGEVAHLTDAVKAGADAVLCASILHYGHHTVPEIKERTWRAPAWPCVCRPEAGATEGADSPRRLAEIQFSEPGVNRAVTRRPLRRTLRRRMHRNTRQEEREARSNRDGST